MDPRQLEAAAGSQHYWGRQEDCPFLGTAFFELLQASGPLFSISYGLPIYEPCLWHLERSPVGESQGLLAEVTNWSR